MSCAKLGQARIKLSYNRIPKNINVSKIWRGTFGFGIYTIQIQLDWMIVLFLDLLAIKPIS